jgi:protein-L-isoaspartate(D-aspartate) O-methyltransferase
MSFDEQRVWMVRTQLEAWGVRDQRVLAAMGAVPRELFVPSKERAAAYYDGALPIGEGQTISQPYVVAHMTELLQLQNDEKALEVGTGSGYQTAVLARLAARVFTIERIPALAERAAGILHELEIANVEFRVGDGSLGWPENAPYDAILVTCAAPEPPPPLLEQLADGGRMVTPVGPKGYQDLMRIVKRDGRCDQERLAPVAFVPLIGQHGW